MKRGTKGSVAGCRLESRTAARRQERAYSLRDPILGGGTLGGTNMTRGHAGVGVAAAAWPGQQQHDLWDDRDGSLVEDISIVNALICHSEAMTTTLTMTMWRCCVW